VVVRDGRHAVGKVAIWRQWLMVAVGVLVSSAFVVLLGWFIGWSHFRRLWRRRKVRQGKFGGLGQLRGGEAAWSVYSAWAAISPSILW
jgi:membrane protein DedA with SNARE-associated domain